MYAFFIQSSCILYAFFIHSLCILHAFLTLNAIFMHSSCILHVFFMYSSCILHTFFMNSLCILGAFFMQSLCNLYKFKKYSYKLHAILAVSSFSSNPWSLKYCILLCEILTSMSKLKSYWWVWLGGPLGKNGFLELIGTWCVC